MSHPVFCMPADIPCACKTISGTFTHVPIPSLKHPPHRQKRYSCHGLIVIALPDGNHHAAISGGIASQLNNPVHIAGLRLIAWWHRER